MSSTADSAWTAGGQAPPGWRQAAVCAALALGFFFAAAQTPLETFRKYTLSAERLVAGELPHERLLDFSPLYLRLSELLVRSGLDGAAWLEGLQIGLAAVSVGLLFLLLEARLGRRLAFAGALIFTLDRHLLVYQRIVEPEMVLLTALLGALWLIERPGVAAAVGAGVLAAIAALTRPTFLPVFCAVPIYYWWRQRESAEAGREWRRLSALFLAPLLVGGVLLTLHLGSPFAPVMNPGTVFFEGNQPLSRGTSAVYPPLVLSMLHDAVEVADSAHEHYRTVARASPSLPRDAPPAEVNGLWSGRARAFLLDEPAAAADRLSTKLRYALHGYRWHDVPSAARYDLRLGWPSLPFSLLSALALIGLVLAARRWPAALPFYLLFAAQMAVMLVFYVSARQRLVLLPAVVFFALLALREVWGHRRRGLLAALALLLALALALPDDAMRDESYRQRGHLVAGPLMGALADGSPLSGRRAEVVEAMAAFPWYVDWMRPAFVRQDDRTLDELLVEQLRQKASPPHSADSADFDLAQALIRVGRGEEARPLLERLAEDGFIAYRGARSPSDPRFFLAQLDARDGELGRAIDRLEAARAERPGDPFALAALAALDPGRRTATLARLDRYIGEPDRRWIYGRTLRWLDRPALAAAELAPLVERLPGVRAPRVHLALALGATGDVDAAAGELLAASRLFVEPVLEIEAAAEIARRWADSHPPTGGEMALEVQLMAAEMLYQHGFPSEAEGRLRVLLAREDLPPRLAGQATRVLADMAPR